MCGCDFSERLYVPACDSLWLSVRWDHVTRTWGLVVWHHHSGIIQSPPVDEYVSLSSSEVSGVACAVLDDLLDPVLVD